MENIHWFDKTFPETNLLMAGVHWEDLPENNL